MDSVINILAIKQLESGEWYFFFYNDENLNKLLKIFHQFARNPDLSFTDIDAAVLSEKAENREPRKQKSRFLILF